ncbi:MAG: hypothetical protein IKN04_14880 [Clostridia bacterium]|nr:hypothetical protein [Clostridia bacterium]
MNRVCNMCGKPFDMWDDQENFGFDYYVGYGSKHDLEHIRANFCCACFDNILDQLVPLFKVPMEIEEYEFSSDCDLDDECIEED